MTITWEETNNTLVYEIWRADIPAFLGGNIQKIGTADETTFSDTTVTEGNRYYYWIKARNSWGVSRYSGFDLPNILVMPGVGFYRPLASMPRTECPEGNRNLESCWWGSGL
ncbi:MAG: hypothetical protein R2875_06490 [Desulfobacterales bacterium]